MNKYLILEDGTCFTGKGFGYDGDVVAEVVFNTGMTGYQEVLSDPSYCGQMVTLTYPLIGNYGINLDDFESLDPAVSGLIVKEHCLNPSNYRNRYTLDEYLKMKKIPGIYDIDTRALTLHIRKYGVIKGIITSNSNVEEMVDYLKSYVMFDNHVERVSTTKAYPSPGRGYRVALIDYGFKKGILRELNKRDCDVIVLPYNVTAEEIRSINPDGIMLSNGPGDPKTLTGAIKTLQDIKGEYPLFGICLGHQLYCLANGADTNKMKFGHRGSNNPVKNLNNNKVIITSQNHGYDVNQESLEQTELILTHISVNDDSIEGVRHSKNNEFTVQFHPEASPGPNDATYLFDEFINMIDEHKKVVVVNA